MTKREMAFVLSLSATVIFLPFLWLFFSLWWKFESVVTFGLIGLVTLIMITGLLFMGISKTKRGRIIGGTIILIMGIIAGILVSLTIAEGIEVVLLIPAVMATIGGYLGIRGVREGEEIKKREYSKRFISGVSITGFIFALASVFVFFLSIAEAHELAVLFFIFFVATPLWIISIILNAISTVIIKRKESISQKRTKILMIMLIIATWCIIASGLAGYFYLFLFLW